MGARNRLLSSCLSAASLLGPRGNRMHEGGIVFNLNTFSTERNVLKANTDSSVGRCGRTEPEKAAGRTDGRGTPEGRKSHEMTCVW